MIDRDAPSTKAALAELDKPGVREKLVKFGMWRMRSEADAEDLLQQALAKVCDPGDSPWTPDSRGGRAPRRGPEEGRGTPAWTAPANHDR